jgi:hypothetical protein
MDLVERVQDILLRPKEAWPEIKAKGTTIVDLFRSYAIILAIIPAVAQIIGVTVIGFSFMGLRYRTPFGSALAHGLLSYCTSLASLYVIAFIMDSLAPKFASQKNMLNAFKLAVYSWTPSWVVGVLLIIPALSWLVALASLYGLYLFYVGLPLLMDTPRDKVTIYFLVVVALSIIVIAFIGAVVALLFLPGRLV